MDVYLSKCSDMCFEKYVVISLIVKKKKAQKILIKFYFDTCSFYIFIVKSVNHYYDDYHCDHQ